MSILKSRKLIHDHNHDGIDRRGFLECMAWAGTGVVLRDQRRRAEIFA